ncbi:type II secretion system major pseudopilin GspG [Ferrimonas balearica]|uniref:type II secretion system major pseudopilin GspG n=1 Tax=Ferrimonas balearica TaxID=44012 RepID=UPI001C991C4C|nr:type II secretion system major pseudopilin GspG [Ferrimonas balearica]MBY5994009.1 type II secretion system major pseudopilin GspG [Ferrimonas balearica]
MKRRTPSRTAQRGFTLLEVMVVLVIIGILASIVAPNLIGSRDTANVQKAVTDISGLESALGMFYIHNNRFPTTDQGLEALVTRPNSGPEPRNYQEGGYIQRLPTDPWGNAYSLVSPGERSRYDLCSAGPDMQLGTEDDICNYNLGDFQ